MKRFASGGIGVLLAVVVLASNGLGTAHADEVTVDLTPPAITPLVSVIGPVITVADTNVELAVTGVVIAGFGDGEPTLSCPAIEGVNYPPSPCGTIPEG
jgi:hypothetical protein